MKLRVKIYVSGVFFGRKTIYFTDRKQIYCVFRDFLHLVSFSNLKELDVSGMHLSQEKYLGLPKLILLFPFSIVPVKMTSNALVH
jgi:hypothetical protein